MSVTDSTSQNSIEDAPPVPPRNDLVKTATEFLLSPKVQTSPMEMKVAFLKKKGLSDAEIDLAVEQSEEVLRNKLKASQLVQHNPHSGMEIVYPPTVWHSRSRWAVYRDIINTINLLVGALYISYWFYKKYIVPYLFGDGRKGLDVRIADLEKTVMQCVNEIKNNMMKMREDMERITEIKNGGINKQIEELKSEVTSLKKLLLSRKQFPTATVPGPLTIPSWQRASSPPAMEKEGEEEGAGSGTNGSDSSLEMIKE